MIDTIKLVLPKAMFITIDQQLFQKGISNACRGYYIYVQNPTKKELKEGIYKPRLTLTNRFNTTGNSEPTLTIELSLPKLMFNNNFDELKDSDFDAVVDTLNQRLKSMGILVLREMLLKAPVSAVHYSKNIILTDGTTPHYLISKIKEADIRLSMGIDQTSYRDGGYSYKWHTNSFEVAFYDKLKDLEQARVSEKRAVETDYAVQLNLFDNMRPRSLFEVLRVEVRLNNRQKIKSLFNKLDLNNSITFKDLFSQDISKKVLYFYIDEMRSNRCAHLDRRSKNTQALLSEVIMHNPNVSLAKCLQFFGLITAIQAIPNRELRAFTANRSKQDWYRLRKSLKEIKLPVSNDPLEVISHAVAQFETVKLVDFKEYLINNDK